MLRYRLDDLGPYQFEKLIQSVLKASLGLGVESWGNRADYGRDSYAPGKLCFPNPPKMSRGPFIFQAKFVEESNAAGSRPAQAVLSSASKERDRIKQRISRGQWGKPRHFLFITNAPLVAPLREKIRSVFRAMLPSCEIHVWSGDDVCDVLDQNADVSRAFPQLLSIRDLDLLITHALQKESRERSAAAVELAKELVPVFAPTRPYERAWTVLGRHHFVVLEGPPEVGKSAIAWMIALTQVGAGWEAIVCRTPDTFFEMWDSNKSQVFIADDAFGRTEYDPTRTSKWEAELDLILHRLGRRHWLIWTSRKHILERACQRMDAQGRARSFPDPGSVLVDVQTLSVEEKALVLFRHAKHAGLEEHAKRLLKKHAPQIVSDGEFTPERIRRLVHEGIPALSKRSLPHGAKDSAIALALRELLRNPTKQMKVAFMSLLPAYKWFLVALLEISEIDRYAVQGADMEELRCLYEAYCPESEREPFEVVTEHLTEAFVRQRLRLIGGTGLDWIHPSYRDLVIEELIADPTLRNTFIKRASLEGIKLAVSDSGGKRGERNLPFMRSAESWDILENRCVALIVNEDQEEELLETLANAASQDTARDNRRKWSRLLSRVCERVHQKWQSRHAPVTADELEAFAEARENADPMPPLPDLEAAWGELEERFRDGIENRKPGAEFDFDPFDDLSKLAGVIQQYAPDYLREKGFPEKYKAEIQIICSEAESEAQFGIDEGDPDTLRQLAERMGSIARAVERLTDISPSYPEAVPIANKLRRQSDQLEELAVQNEPGEPDYYNDGGNDRSEEFDVGMLFSEL